MIPDIVGQASGRFDQRFFLTALVPTAVFVPAITAVLLWSTDSFTAAATLYLDQTPLLQVLLWLGAAAVIWFLATLLASQWTNIVRLYEGYPIERAFAWLNRYLDRLHLPARFRGRPTGIAGHQRRLAKMRTRDSSLRSAHSAAIAAAYELEPVAMVYDSYPPSMDRVMPTSVGNILRAAEDYGSNRYGFDAIHLWTRLTVVLPTDYLADIERAIVEYQTPLVVSFGSALLAMSSLGLVYTAISTQAFLAIFLGSLGASWIAYRMSFGAAKAYGDLLRSAVDLFRNDLLERWWPELLTVDDGRRRLEMLREFVLTGTKPSLSSVRHRRAGAATSPAADSVSQLIVVESRIRRQAEIETEATEPDPGEVPRFGLRLSMLMAVGALLVAFAASHRLDQRVWVVVAKNDTPAFNSLTGGVETTAMRRGDVDPDAFASGENRDQLVARLAELETSIALHRIGKAEVVRRSDVGPRVTPGASPGLVIEVELSPTQIEALDLRAGDSVLVTGTDVSGAPASCFTPSGASVSTSEPTTASSLIDAMVLAIVGSGPRESANVVLNIESSAASCLGDPGGIRVLRDRTADP